MAKPVVIRKLALPAALTDPEHGLNARATAFSQKRDQLLPRLYSLEQQYLQAVKAIRQSCSHYRPCSKDAFCLLCWSGTNGYQPRRGPVCYGCVFYQGEGKPHPAPRSVTPDQ